MTAAQDENAKDRAAIAAEAARVANLQPVMPDQVYTRLAIDRYPILSAEAQRLGDRLAKEVMAHDATGLELSRVQAEVVRLTDALRTKTIHATAFKAQAESARAERDALAKQLQMRDPVAEPPPFNQWVLVRIWCGGRPSVMKLNSTPSMDIKEWWIGGDAEHPIPNNGDYVKGWWPLPETEKAQ